MLYLFVDELQEIDGFEKALRNFQAEGNIDIYGTGSNAKLLSGELATYLSGRYIEIKIYGLTYTEFLQFHNLARGRESFKAYLKFGGLPYLRHLNLKEEVVFDYLRNILDAILLKDIVSRSHKRSRYLITWYLTIFPISPLLFWFSGQTEWILLGKRFSKSAKNTILRISVYDTLWWAFRPWTSTKC